MKWQMTVQRQNINLNKQTIMLTIFILITFLYGLTYLSHNYRLQKWLKQNLKIDIDEYSKLNLNTKNILCPRGTFATLRQRNCREMLNCTEIYSIQKRFYVGGGQAKRVSVGVWNDQLVAVSTPYRTEYWGDFQDGIQIMKEIGNGLHTSQTIGYCKATNTTITHYQRHGSATEILNLLTELNTDITETRFGLCIDYVAIVKYLHLHPMGPRINCDTETVHKTLTQYLITDDLHLILNDLDAVVIVRQNGVKKFHHCGHHETYKDLFAPEQRWTYDEPYDDDRMTDYDERTDIWKIPTVCEYFLGENENAVRIKQELLDVHTQCKLVQADRRPTAGQVLDVYLKVWYRNGYHMSGPPGRLKLV